MSFAGESDANVMPCHVMSCYRVGKENGKKERGTRHMIHGPCFYNSKFDVFSSVHVKVGHE